MMELIKIPSGESAMRSRITLVMMLAAGLTSGAAMAQSPAGSPAVHTKPQGMELDLSKQFHTRSAWRFVVTEGLPVKDFGDNDAPGALTLCLRKGAGEQCLSDPVTLPLRTTTPDDSIAWEPHYLIVAKVVYPRGLKEAPFLMIVTGSLNSGNGDQIVSTQLVAYDAEQDAFKRVYGKSTGHNNNQEIRFVTDGPLRGSVISAEPQEHLPYGYWIVVSDLTPAGEYRQVVRYPSATRYGDGNPLAVIDSEMPSIEKRLGLWKPGDLLPTPSRGSDGKPCLKPTLRRAELWCD
jgi:hypothetical protein